MSRAPGRRAPVLALLAGAWLAGGALLGGCRSQRWPSPMEGAGDRGQALPSGAVSPFPPGPTDVLVVRHGDPVQVRRAGEIGSFPLAFYGKQERVFSGGWMLVGPGGRGEIVWPADGSSAVFFGEGACSIGEPTRGEPLLFVRSLERLRVMLAPGKRVRLPGGGELGPKDALVASGPFQVSATRGVLRVRNQSTGDLLVTYGGVEYEIGPGDTIDLAVLSPDEPPAPLAAPVRHRGAEGRVALLSEGAVEPFEVERGVGLAAGDEALVSGRGVRVRLESGDRVSFSDFGDPAGVRPRRTPSGELPPPAPPPVLPAELATPPRPPMPAPARGDALVPAQDDAARDGAEATPEVPPMKEPAPADASSPPPIAPEQDTSEESAADDRAAGDRAAGDPAAGDPAGGDSAAGDGTPGAEPSAAPANDETSDTGDEPDAAPPETPDAPLDESEAPPAPDAPPRA